MRAIIGVPAYPNLPRTSLGVVTQIFKLQLLRSRIRFFFVKPTR